MLSDSKMSLLNYMPLRAPMPRDLGVLVPHVPRASRALLPHVLRALLVLVPHVPIVPRLLPALTSCPSELACLMCLHQLSCSCVPVLHYFFPSCQLFGENYYG